MGSENGGRGPDRGPVLICVDLSKGMEGRLDEMKRGAWRIVDSFAGSSLAVLAFDGRETSVALPPTRDGDAALDAIDALGSDVLDGSGKSGPLAAAVSILPGGGTVFLLTDGLGLPRDTAGGDSAACREAGIRVVSFGFGNYDWNLLRKVSSDVCPGAALGRRRLRRRCHIAVCDAWSMDAEVEEARKLLEGGDPSALPILERRAGSGDPEAMYLLGAALMDGVLAPEDPSRAAGLWERAAEAGHPDAMLNVGICYIMGDGVGRDLDKGMSWVRRAADAGVEDARSMLSSLEEERIARTRRPASRSSPRASRSGTDRPSHRPAPRGPWRRTPSRFRSSGPSS